MVDSTAVSTLTLDIEQDGKVAIVHCHGTLVSRPEDPLYQLLYDEVSRLMAGGQKVVVDLSDLSQISDIGISKLLELLSYARKVGCEFELFHPSARVLGFLQEANLMRVFTVVSSMQSTP
jgi:anti-anti-sigma factor